MARGSLATFVEGLPTGSHALVLLGRVPFQQAVEAVQQGAGDDLVWMCGLTQGQAERAGCRRLPDEVLHEWGPEGYARLCGEAEAEGRDGALVVTHMEGCALRGSPRQVVAHEYAVGPSLPTRVRMVCLATPAFDAALDEDEFLVVAWAHSHTFVPSDLQGQAHAVHQVAQRV